jgi:hypothetical protein
MNSNRGPSMVNWLPRGRTIRTEGADCPRVPEKPKLSLYDSELFTDCPTGTFGPSVAEPWLAVELAGGGSDLSFGWNLFP